MTTTNKLEATRENLTAANQALLSLVMQGGHSPEKLEAARAAVRAAEAAHNAAIDELREPPPAPPVVEPAAETEEHEDGCPCGCEAEDDDGEDDGPMEPPAPMTEEQKARLSAWLDGAEYGSTTPAETDPRAERETMPDTVRPGQSQPPPAKPEEREPTIEDTNRATARIHAARAERREKVGRATWEMGDALGKIKDGRLFKQGGFSGFAACVRDRMGIEPGEAEKMIRMARAFTADELAAVGVEKASEMLKAKESDTFAGLKARAVANPEAVTLGDIRDALRREKEHRAIVGMSGGRGLAMSSNVNA